MTRIECEQAIAEHLKSIYEIYREYDNSRLNLRIHLGSRQTSNDFGNSWTEAYFDVDNGRFPKDEKLISFRISIPIFDGEYKAAREKHISAYNLNAEDIKKLDDNEKKWFGKSFYYEGGNE